jgi:glutaredoxin 3
VAKFELYGTAVCPYTQEMREWLEWRRCEFVEYDVEADAEARRRMRALAGAGRTVPVLVEDGKVAQVGWHGRGCMVEVE